MSKFKKQGRYDWKVAKIRQINYFTWFMILITTAWEMAANLMGHDDNFKPTDLSTWGVRHLLLAIFIISLIVEMALLFKAKHMDPTKLFEDLEKLKKK